MATDISAIYIYIGYVSRLYHHLQLGGDRYFGIKPHDSLGAARGACKEVEILIEEGALLPRGGRGRQSTQRHET